MTAVSKEARDQIQSYVDGYPDAWRGGICAYAVCNRKDGKDVYGAVRTGACHYGVAYPDTNNPIVVNAVRPNFNRELSLWLAREAPFSHGVLNKDNTDEITGKAFVIDTEIVGTGGALWLCKALRTNKEDDWTPKFWTTLRNEGLTGLQAFIGAEMLAFDGSPKRSLTHTSLFRYGPPDQVREWYDKFSKIDKMGGGQANTNVRGLDQAIHNWGSLAGKRVKKPDGWGGFVEVNEPCNAKEYAAKLKEIFEGDPSNVK